MSGVASQDMEAIITCGPTEVTATILPDGRSIGGILQVVQSTGVGLVFVNVSGMEYLVDEMLLGELRSLTGKRVCINHALGTWGACEI